MLAKDRIAALRAIGFGVHIDHYRPLADNPRGSEWSKHDLNIENADAHADDPLGPERRYRFSEKGGITEVSILANDQVVAQGSARCSYKDHFCRRTGIEIALDRAVLDLAGRAHVRPLDEYHSGRR